MMGVIRMHWKRRQIWLFILGTLLAFTSLTFTPDKHVEAFSAQVIQRGATGDDVIELQARLQYIGIFKGKINGIFSWSTYWALRNFQKKYGLNVDGLAGQTTKNKLSSVSQYNRGYIKSNLRKGNDFTYYGGVPLKRQTSESYDHDGQKANTGNNAGTNNVTPNRGAQNNVAPAPTRNSASGATTNKTNAKYTVNNLPQGFSQQDIKLLANAVYGESRGEPFIGQVAVAAVILNRVDSPKFPDTVSGVIFQPGAFTAVSDGQIWLTPNEKAKQAVMDAINGWDPSHGALYYFNPAKASSAWIWSRPQIEKIGKHIFCK